MKRFIKGLFLVSLGFLMGFGYHLTTAKTIEVTKPSTEQLFNQLVELEKDRIKSDKEYLKVVERMYDGLAFDSVQAMLNVVSSTLSKAEKVEQIKNRTY